MAMMPLQSIRAAVARHAADAFELGAVEIGALRPDELLVRLVATGMCHADIGMIANPSVPKPIVLGHEGAGVVERVGAAVMTFSPGDHVVLSFDSCGNCSACWSGHPAYCRSSRA